MILFVNKFATQIQVPCHPELLPDSANHGRRVIQDLSSKEDAEINSA
jgi:hypothetical protein